MEFDSEWPIRCDRLSIIKTAIFVLQSVGFSSRSGDATGRYSAAIAFTLCGSALLSMLSSISAAAQTSASYQLLGVRQGGSHSSGAALDFDGTVVVGLSRVGLTSEAFRWTASSGFVGLGFLDPTGGPGLSPGSAANGVSSNGSIVVGHSINSLGNFEAFRYAGGVMQALGYLPGQAGANRFSTAYGASADGLVVVGDSTSGATAGAEAFRWTAGAGMQALGFLPGAVGQLGGNLYSSAKGVNGDGSVIVGSSNNRLGQTQAVRWNGTVIEPLGSLTPNGSSYATAVSGNGAVVVGAASVVSGLTEPFMWTTSSGMVSLGSMGPTAQQPLLARMVASSPAALHISSFKILHFAGLRRQEQKTSTFCSRTQASI